MEKLLKEALGSVQLDRSGGSTGGCINKGQTYITETGEIFAKSNSKPGARTMFDGEYEGLKAIAKTNTVKVPNPVTVIDNPIGGAILVLEYLDMEDLSKFSRELGEKLADLHLHNALQKSVQHSEDDDVHYVNQFGFHIPTCCGYLPQDNNWCDNWVTFFTRQRLEHQIKLVEGKSGGREVRELWSQLHLKIPTFFKGIESSIEPSLLHGDLWGGNAAETTNEPVVFDPAVFYGHHEYDLAIGGMFGGFSRSFFAAYHRKIPKAPGFDIRHKLYQLFHYLNHWNHFGASYKESSISIMKLLLKS